jgi:hypothetical protein
LKHDHDSANLIISLFEGLIRQSIPDIGFVEISCHFDGNIQVATFHGEIEASCFFLDEMEGNL